MPNHNIMTPRLDEAMRMAAYAHRDQVRKGTEIPYIVHPFEVMTIATSVTDDEDTLVACLLHDVLEDASGEYDRSAMERDFGARVVEIVSGVTKSDTLTDWHERSKAYLVHLQKEAPIESLIVCTADKIHNLMSILIDYETHGDVLWERFNSSKQDQLWWYQSVLEVVAERMSESPLVTELRGLVEQMSVIVET